MLQDHERAALMANDANVPWHHFVASRVLGPPERGGRVLNLEVTAAAQASAAHAQFRGLLEYSTNSSLPVVLEFLGTIDLENREVRLEGAQNTDPAHSYVGSFSENG